ncbi:MAG: DUF4136 domain-containing protein [Muribaculaceae bacterium]
MKKIFYLFVIALLFASCSPFSLINSTVYNNADLSTYNTFRIVSLNDGKLPPGMGLVGYYNISAAIREQMLNRGFTENPNSDLLVNIALTVQQQIDTEPIIPPGYSLYNGYYPYYMYPRNLYWQGYYSNAKVITDIYKEGVLTMEMVNIAEKLPLYSSSVSTILNPGQAQLKNLNEIADAVKILFSQFPVPLLPQYKK